MRKQSTVEALPVPWEAEAEAAVEDFRGELGWVLGLGFVGDAEREEAIEGALETRGNELVFSTAYRSGAIAETGKTSLRLT
jgi:hypothetical protein